MYNFFIFKSLELFKGTLVNLIKFLFFCTYESHSIILVSYFFSSSRVTQFSSSLNFFQFHSKMMFHDLFFSPFLLFFFSHVLLVFSLFFCCFFACCCGCCAMVFLPVYIYSSNFLFNRMYMRDRDR